MIVINFFGAPGSGKSTSTARLFARMKGRGLNVELVSEYAKQLTWDERFNTLTDQIYVFGKQQRALNRLIGKVDYVVNDGPLIQSITYKQESLSETFDRLVLEEFSKHQNINIFMERNVPYATDGRKQSAQESILLEKNIIKLLEETKQTYQKVFTTHFESVMDQIIDKALIMKNPLPPLALEKLKNLTKELDKGAKMNNSLAQWGSKRLDPLSIEHGMYFDEVVGRKRW